MSGLWDKLGIPHKSWRCIDVEDLGAEVERGEEVPYSSCAMCDNERIRYVHYMEHDDYPDVLGVGCVCAAKMAEDYDGPRDRERKLRNRAARRARWLHRNWKISAKGNAYLRINGHTLTVFPQVGHWGYSIAFPDYSMLGISRPSTKFSRRKFDTCNKATLALFDAFADIIGWD